MHAVLTQIRHFSSPVDFLFQELLLCTSETECVSPDQFARTAPISLKSSPINARHRIWGQPIEGHIQTTFPPANQNFAFTFLKVKVKLYIYQKKSIFSMGSQFSHSDLHACIVLMTTASWLQMQKWGKHRYSLSLTIQHQKVFFALVLNGLF